MQPSAMQGDVPERKPYTSKTGDDMFDEMVCTSKEISSIFPLIGCTQIHSALRRGVQLLSEAESGPLKNQGQRKSAPELMEGISRVPKNAAQLKPVIEKLMCKVIGITIWQVSTNASTQCRISQRESIKSGLGEPKR